MPDGEVGFKCLECGHWDRYLSKLRRHVAGRHSNSRPHACLFCNHRSKTSSNRQVHLRIKHGVVLTNAQIEEMERKKAEGGGQQTF